MKEQRPKAASKHGEGRHGAGQPQVGGSDQRLEERSRAELYALAQQLDIPGHAEMSKAELVEAIRRR